MNTESNLDDLYWLAGLLEAEGSFLRPVPSSPNRPIVKVEMTDRDVIEHVANWWGVSVSLPTKRQPHHLQSYQCLVRGRTAADLMRQLSPFMGVRRQQQIAAALQCYSPTCNGIYVSEAEALEIHRRASTGESRNSIAAHHQRNIKTVRRILAKDPSAFVRPTLVPLQPWQSASESERFRWLSGWLEGEGHFGYSRRVVLSASTTDADLLERLRGYGGSFSQYVPDNPTWSKQYEWNLISHAAIRMMIRLYPHMFVRRRAAIVNNLERVLAVASQANTSTRRQKLTFADAEIIRSLHTAGRRVGELAREYGVSSPAISQILSGKNHSPDSTSGKSDRLRGVLQQEIRDALILYTGEQPSIEL